MDYLQRIENEQGRVREQKWGPRTLDLDILLYGDEIIQGDHLEVPHFEMHKRGFVLLPLDEISPDCVIPGVGSVQTLLQQVNTDDLVVLA